ncbi:carbohydrate ABC transporter substrate-binding protein [Gordoniibacillus kamchatkensis]|uniref:carbohydrate ABC transporter substrate-binding protein n=1 Tax=Gordoniibacillus kamchatkensis TaxID=1590651 RepID=UPI000695B390|nr:carbohydrate ABC transporter substrate-binding protein [Paenibacillus sp. VKM B-2647]
MSKQAKTWLSGIGVLTAVSLFAAGCGNSGAAGAKQGAGTGGQEAKKQQELNIAVFEGGFGKKYWEDISKKFEADHPGTKVNITSNPKILDVIKPQMIAGNPPDFMYINVTDDVKAMISDKAFADITDVFDATAPGESEKIKDKLIDGVLENGKPYGDGKVYLAPTNLTVLGLWYNKTLFQQKGWKVPETWDEFLALGEAAKKEGRSLFTYQGMYPSYNESVFWPTLASVGGPDLLKKIADYEEGSFRSEPVKKVLSVYDQMAKKGYVMPGTVAMNHTQAQTEFLQGKALFIPNGSWFEGEMKDAPREEGFQFGFMAPPVFNKGDQRYALTSNEIMVVPAKAKNKDLAKEFIKYQYKKESIILNAQLSGSVMPVKSGADMVKDSIPKSTYEAMKVFDNGVKQFPSNGK